MTDTNGPEPILLTANQPLARPYRGGAGIARFRGTPFIDEHTPEDFVGSVTEVFAGGGVGLSALPNGTLLKDAIEADPIAYLGARHVERFGTQTMLLVKLLDSGERLFVHFHPDDDFAAQHYARAIGKTEAWIVIDTDETVAGFDGGYALVGFRESVARSTIERWVSEQDVPAMLSALNRVPLSLGDTLLLPAGTAHAIGPGLTLVELQQPTDLSIILEHSGFPGLGAHNAFAGLDPQLAMSGLNVDATDASTLEALATPAQNALSDSDTRLTPLLPHEAERFFSAWRVELEPEHGALYLSQTFAIAIVVAGSGTLVSQSGTTLAIAQGDTVLIPFAAGPVRLEGQLSAVVCAPPAIGKQQ